MTNRNPSRNKKTPEQFVNDTLINLFRNYSAFIPKIDRNSFGLSLKVS